jgi:hypothetical protein
MTPEQIRLLSDFQKASDNLVRCANQMLEMGIINAPVREFLLRGHTAAHGQIDRYILSQSKSLPSQR